jgi:hypothetical protein
MRRYRGLVVLAMLWGCVPFAPMSCGAPPDVSQFGDYAGPFKRIRLPDGDTLTVYRIKYWKFDSGDAPALQIEYQTQVDISDTIAVKAEARRIWPVFRPYIDAVEVSNAIITATDRKFQGNGVAHVTRMHHFGTIAVRDSSSTWHFSGESVPLDVGFPVASSSGSVVGIFERSGEPLSTTRKR